MELSCVCVSQGTMSRPCYPCAAYGNPLGEHASQRVDPMTASVCPLPGSCSKKACFRNKMKRYGIGGCLLAGGRFVAVCHVPHTENNVGSTHQSHRWGCCVWNVPPLRRVSKRRSKIMELWCALSKGPFRRHHNRVPQTGIQWENTYRNASAR